MPDEGLDERNRFDRADPDPRPAESGPPQRAEKDGSRCRVRERQHELRAVGTGASLVLTLKMLEDPLPTVGRMGGNGLRKRNTRFDPLDAQPQPRHRRDTDDPVTVERDRDDRLSDRAFLEPPAELVGIRGRPPDVLHERQDTGPVRLVVRRVLDAHFGPVPRRRLKAPFTALPATESLTAMESHAPERTSSSVRTGYGSTL